MTEFEKRDLITLKSEIEIKGLCRIFARGEIGLGDTTQSVALYSHIY